MAKKRGRKKSQSEVITIVLLVLIVIIAVVIVWNVVLPMINKSRESADIGLISTNVEITNAKLYLTGGADIQVKRLAGQGNITSLKFIFYDKSSNSNPVTVSGGLEELQTKTFKFGPTELNFNNKDISRVSVVPILGNNVGSESKETDSQINKDSSGNRVLDTKTESGLVSWFRFDGNLKDSVSGDSLVCSSCPEKTKDINGKSDMAYSFDGVSDYLNSSALTSYTSLPSITVSFWMYPRSHGGGGSGGGTILIGDSDAPATVLSNSWFVQYWNSRILEFDIYGSSSNVANTFAIPVSALNSWHHVVETYDGTNQKLYVNGGLVDSKPNNAIINPGARKLMIGSGLCPSAWGCGDGYYNGSIDNVMIFNKALSDSEIAALYNNQKA